MNGWEFAGYGLWFTAVLGAIGFFARESWRGGRSHHTANELIGDVHQPVLEQAQAWQLSAGAGTTAFPASNPPQPSRLDAPRLWLGRAWSTLRAQLRGGDRFAVPGGKHTPTDRWSTADVARNLLARPHLNDEEVQEIKEREVREFVRQQFENARAAGQPADAAGMPARLPWDVVDRAKGSASVDRPFDEQVRVRDDWLHGRVRAAANEEPTTLLPTVPPAGAR